MSINPALRPRFSLAVTAIAAITAAGFAVLAGPSQAPAQADVVATEVAPPPVPKKPRLQKHEEMPALPGEGWKPLFDGKTLKGWKITDYAGHGNVEVKDGTLVLGMGAMLTGVNGPTNLFKTNYEMAFDARRLMGSDFFATVTFPVGEDSCSLVLGGWGGGLVGISSLDGMDASENSTSSYLQFKDKQWYRIRVRVTLEKLQCWIGELQVVDEDIRHQKITVRPGEIEMSQPLGFSSWVTAGALKDIQWRSLD